MKIRKIEGDYSIYKVEKNGADLSGLSGFVFIGSTDAELSVVCESGLVTRDVLAEEGNFVLFGIVGQLDFSLTGVIAKIATVLSESGVGIFVVSTYDTDYFLVKKDAADIAVGALAKVGYIFE